MVSGFMWVQRVGQEVRGTSRTCSGGGGEGECLIMRLRAEDWCIVELKSKKKHGSGGKFTITFKM